MEENSSISFWKIAVTVLLAALLIGMVFFIARQGKAVVNDKLEEINYVISENQSDGYLIYENTRVSGNEVLSVIKKAVNNQDYICVRVITGMNMVNGKKNGTDYNFTGEDTENGYIITKIEVPSECPKPNAEGKTTEQDYVNPQGVFRCDVKRNANGSLVALIFTQEI